MALLTKEFLLTKGDLKKEKVMLTDKDYVFVREMTGKERDWFEQSLLKKVKRAGKDDYESNLDNFRSKLAVITMCDVKGDALLSPTDFVKFSESISAAQLSKIVDVAQRLNAMNEKDKDDLVKN